MGRKKNYKKQAVETAIAKWKAIENYDNAFIAYCQTLTSLSEDRFWQLVYVLKKLIIERKSDKLSDIRMAIDEFARKAYANDFGDLPFVYTFEEVLRFYVTWERYYLDDELSEFVDDRGDDSTYDLLDSLPLAGKEIYNKFKNEEYKSMKDFKKDLKKLGKFLFEFINDGENYFGMTMKDCFTDFFMYECIKK